MGKKAIILVNVGTPTNSSRKEVKSFLSEFLNDPLVMDIPWLFRKILVNFLIIPFRTPRSTVLYEKLWMEGGSPLMLHGLSSREKLKKMFPGDEVFFTTRYGKNNIIRLLSTMQDQYEKLVLFPLFPHYSRSTTGTVIQAFYNALKSWNKKPNVSIVPPFFGHESFIKSMLKVSQPYKPVDYDHVLFSFHGLPLKQVFKYKECKCCRGEDCTTNYKDEYMDCYKATCYQTARLLAKELDLPGEKFSVCFQSRLSSGWLSPFTDKVIKELANDGKKKLLVFSPSFVADCLETTVEIGIQYQGLFQQHGGEKIQLVESLNDHPIWIQAMQDIILQAIKIDETDPFA